MQIWPLCFPSEQFEENASLPDIYETALLKDPIHLKGVLTNCLTIQPDSIESWIVDYFSCPWHRIYTLNIDNLVKSLVQRFSLPRLLEEISATNLSSPSPRTAENQAVLEVICLNGTIADIPNNVTFSSSHYAKRLAYPDQFYQQLVADIVSRPVVFVGTSLDETPLWQSIEIRKAKGPRDTYEMRPRSYLVTPNLDRARKARLSSFNIMWIPMTAEEFSLKVLRKVSSSREAGLRLLKVAKSDSSVEVRLSEVADLATDPESQSQFLLGQEPIWADIQSGRAVERASDNLFWELFQSAISDEGQKGILVISGTAGSGKSTTLMRLVLRATAKGHRIAWVDRRTELSPREIISSIEEDTSLNLIAIDDADMFGLGLSSMLHKIANLEKNPLAIVALRSGVIDKCLNTSALGGLQVKELSVPHLTDSDIDALINVLERENRLGVLRAKPFAEQKAMFKEYSGRQLLVAMISATSGTRFEERIPDEFFELPEDSQRVYSVIALASTFRHHLSKQDILIALNDSSNESLNALNLLLRRHIVVEVPPGCGNIQARHRVIAKYVRDALRIHGKIHFAIRGLAFMAATYFVPGIPRNNRYRKILTHVINHDFLFRNLDMDCCQALYQELERLLAGDHHYWLQRGSLEVESGDLRLAENFLGQARGLSSNNLLIETEWAYLLFRKALLDPGGTSSQTLAQEATDLAMNIMNNPYSNPHPFHVLGSQGLAWSRSGLSRRDQKSKYLQNLLSNIKKGLQRFPRNPDLKQLRSDLEKEYLSQAIQQKG